MKRVFLSLLFLSLLVLPFFSAVQINMKSNFSQGETLMANVSGNFLNPLQDSNVLLYNGHIRVSFIPYVNSENGIYYIYGQLSGKPFGNYSLVLSGIRYYESNKIQTADISKNFTISNNTADFSISPGFASVQQGDSFFITAQNLKENALNIESSLSGSPRTQTTLTSGESKNIYFSTSGFNNSEIYATLNSSGTSYAVPVFLSSLQPLPGNQLPVFDIQPTNLNISLPTSSSTTRYIYISNPSNFSESFYVNVSGNLRSYVYILNNSFTIAPNSTKRIEANIVSKDNESLTSGTVSVTSIGLTKKISLLLNFSNSYVPSSETGNSSQSLFKTCAQLGGIQCNGTSTCSGETKDAQDGACCLGACQAQKPVNNAGKIIGWSLVALLVVSLAIFLLRRYGKAKKPSIKLPGFKKKK